jgi:hypothetical protein
VDTAHYSEANLSGLDAELGITSTTNEGDNEHVNVSFFPQLKLYTQFKDVAPFVQTDIRTIQRPAQSGP